MTGQCGLDIGIYMLCYVMLRVSHWQLLYSQQKMECEVIVSGEQTMVC
jgi:hypothetical protein